MVSPERNKKQVCDEDHPLAIHEWLVSQILQSMADPRAVCKLALVNKNFCTASRSNLVWQKLLPPAAHLDALLAADMSVDAQSLSKRELYFLLCRPSTYEGGLKKFWLDPFTAGVCYMMSSRALSICSVDVCKHWKWKPCRGSWFTEVAYLRQICLFEVCGTFRQLLRPGCYVVSFRMQLYSNTSWKGKPVQLCVQNTTYSHPPKMRQVCFDNPHSLSCAMYQSPAPPHLKGKRHDRLPVWVECDVGEFTVEDENEGLPVEVTFSMKEVHLPRWKTGFVLDGVMIRPRWVVDNLGRERPRASSFVSQAWLRSFDDKYIDYEDDSNEASSDDSDECDLDECDSDEDDHGDSDDDHSDDEDLR